MLDAQGNRWVGTKPFWNGADHRVILCRHTVVVDTVVVVVVPVFVVDDPALGAGQCTVEGTLDQARRAASRADKRKEEEEQRLAEPIAVHEAVEDDDGVVVDGAEPGERAGAKRRKVGDGSDSIVVLEDD